MALAKRQVGPYAARLISVRSERGGKPELVRAGPLGIPGQAFDGSHPAEFRFAEFGSIPLW